LETTQPKVRQEHHQHIYSHAAAGFAQKRHDLRSMVALFHIIESSTGPPETGDVSIPPALMSILQACFQRNAEARPTAAALLQVRIALQLLELKADVLCDSTNSFQPTNIII
jgi:hypothetical protein